jgi:hypothetical protein
METTKPLTPQQWREQAEIAKLAQEGKELLFRKPNGRVGVIYPTKSDKQDFEPPEAA